MHTSKTDSKRFTHLLILALCIILIAVTIKLLLPPNASNVVEESVTESPPTEQIISEGYDLYTLIPEGWQIFDHPNAQTEGDLNGDGLSDVAMVIEKKEGDDPAPSRALLIAFGNKDQLYTLSIVAENVILDAQSGGVWGDPFESISITDGVLNVQDYGGSNWRWYNRYQFQFLDQEWVLIGATFGSYFTGDTLPEDADEEIYNFLTGTFVTKKKDAQGNIVITEGNREIKPLIQLKAFDLTDF